MKRKERVYLLREAKMLAARMDSRLLLPFIFLLCSLVCVLLLFVQRLLKPRRWWRGRSAGNLLWFWVFVVCRDEGSGRANTRLCVLLLSCSPLLLTSLFLGISSVFVLLSVPCVREDGDQRWPSGFLMAFVSVFCSVSGFCFWLDSSVLDSVFSGFLLCFLGFSFVFFCPSIWFLVSHL